MHGWSLLAVMARFSGRFDEAGGYADTLANVADHGDHVPWLAWAARFCVATATGARGATPPFPPDTGADPVVQMAFYVIEAELTVAGRVDEALAHVDRNHADLGTIGDLAAVVQALALVLAGRRREGEERARRAARAARALEAGPTARAAAALLAEITGDRGDLAPAPEAAGGIADALVLRAHAAGGDDAARRTLERDAPRLAMPGLLLEL